LKEIPPLSKLKEECELLKQVVDNMETRIVLCHNDLLWTNIIDLPYIIP
jgi:thiamine kinase-like enzyme